MLRRSRMVNSATNRKVSPIRRNRSRKPAITSTTQSVTVARKPTRRTWRWSRWIVGNYTIFGAHGMNIIMIRSEFPTRERNRVEYRRRTISPWALSVSALNFLSFFGAKHMNERKQLWRTLFLSTRIGRDTEEIACTTIHQIMLDLARS